MRIVLDTNVLIAAFGARGTCHELIEHCRRHHELVTGSVILDEFEHKLVGKLRVSAADAREARKLVESGMTVVAFTSLDAPVCRDPDDDQIVAVALSSACACLITGDQDLLVLTPFQNIQILSPSEFWRYEASHR